MRLICKWATICNDCGDRIEEGDDLWLVQSSADEKQKLCWDCANLNGYLCECGNEKKPDYDMCWDCKQAEQQRTGTRCACGRSKRPQYPTCYSCKQSSSTIRR